MKLFSSFTKELKIASRGFYFYIEILMAAIILGVFLFLVPDNFSNQTTEYIYLDLPAETSEAYLDGIENQLDEVTVQQTQLTIDDREEEVTVYTTPDQEIYFLNSREDVMYMADVEREVAATIQLDENNELEYEYYLQGYESDKYKDLLKILHVESSETIEQAVDNQEVRTLSTNAETFTDKENMMPSVLVFNGALMGLFIIAAYIFLDRQEGVIKAFALTPAPVWQYLMSKIGVIMVTSIASSFIVIIPIMQLKPDYLLLLILLVTTAFFSSALGLLIASFYQNIMQAFGALYSVMMLMIIPNIAYFMPSWNPTWVKVIPSYYMLEGFKTVLLGSNDWQYITMISGGFLAVGLILFLLSNVRYNKTLVG